ncbi:putative protein OS=Streptomyces rimosus subsp. rimosus (strain ATCC / DSM 40260 / JCM 4667 / NRRL 2234) OX=1265868 GN=SRIM_004245 PE=3 SV=1 [Streptomyces rimosus subsp. rimosus]
MRRRGWVAGWLGAGALVLTACGGGGEGPPHHPSESARPSPGTADSPSAKPAERRGDGAELIHRESGKGSAQNPAFAPDGKSLLFTVFHGGYNEGAAALRVLPLAHRDGREFRTAVRDLLDEHDRAAVDLPVPAGGPRQE